MRFFPPIPGARACVFASLVALGFAPTSANAAPLDELTNERAAACTSLGTVTGSDAVFVGLSAGIGSRRARGKAEKQATELGADAVLWSQRGSSMTNEWIGTAYRCAAAGLATEATATPPAATAAAATPAAAAAAPVALAEGLVEVTAAGPTCRELGAITATNKIFVGLSAGIGSRRAKAKAVKQATELGADTVVWTERGTGMTNAWTGTAYRCN